MKITRSPLTADRVGSRMQLEADNAGNRSNANGAQFRIAFWFERPPNEGLKASARIIGIIGSVTLIALLPGLVRPASACFPSSAWKSWGFFCLSTRFLVPSRASLQIGANWCRTHQAVQITHGASIRSATARFHRGSLAVNIHSSESSVSLLERMNSEERSGLQRASSRMRDSRAQEWQNGRTDGRAVSFWRKAPALLSFRSSLVSSLEREVGLFVA